MSHAVEVGEARGWVYGHLNLIGYIKTPWPSGFPG